MSNELCLIRQQLLTNIADAIRTKKNVNTQYYPSEMPTAIASIETGITPAGSTSITTNGSHDVTNYAIAVVSVNTESHAPITVNITQSEHQTISVKCNTTFNTKYTSGTYTAPSSLSLSATVTPDSGYTAGTLNQTNVTAQWGNTYSFSATPATEILVIPVLLNITWDGTCTNMPSSVELEIVEKNNSDNNTTVIFTAANNWLQTINLKASTSYKSYLTAGLVVQTTTYVQEYRDFDTPATTNSQPISATTLYGRELPTIDDLEAPL